MRTKKHKPTKRKNNLICIDKNLEKEIKKIQRFLVRGTGQKITKRKASKVVFDLYIKGKSPKLK
tara:strand:- start:847 stop:1038 length:192 start_codon:yes stop_codon:yes gene_type:complete